MKILETRVYRGPNLYALRPVIRLRVDLEELEDYPDRPSCPGFADRLLAMIPTLYEHGCSYGEPGGFVRRMTEDEGTWLGHVLEHVAIELQCLAGTPVTYGKTRGARPAARAVPRHLQLRRGGGRPGGGRARAARSSATCCRPSAPAIDPAPLRFPGRARGPRAPRPAPRLRPLDRRPGARRRGARHPLDPPERPLAGAARLRQVPAAHPGDGHQRDPPHRRRDRLGQAADQPAPRQPRAARCRGRRCVCDADEAVDGRRAARLPGGGQAARRQPRPRRGDQPHDRRRRCATAFEKAYELLRCGARRDLPARATTTASWWSTARSWRSPSACPATSSATAGTPSPSWSRSSTATRGAASATRRC